MIDLLTEVRPGANRYISGAGVLKDLPEYLEIFDNIAVVTGEKSFAIFQDYYQGDFPYNVYKYDGSSSEEDGARLSSQIEQADLIIAIGGGRVIDTAKIVSQALTAELFVIPTLISNCAPYTPILPVYTQEDHKFRYYTLTDKAPFLTLVDWDFLLNTPVDYLRAGIADTLAKWYEIEGIVRNLPASEQTAPVRLGIAIAKEILDILFTNSKEAVTSLEEKVVTSSFGRIADTIIALAGGVGGFATTYGRVSGAHAIHNGLSLLPETHEVLHGLKVGYGILVQLAYTNDEEEIKRILPFYQDLQLPTNLEEINVSAEDLEKLRPVAEFAASEKESFRILDEHITTEKVLQAIEKVEKLVCP